MKSVVIGGQGFIGSEVVRSLLLRGDHVTVIDRRANEAQCSRIFGERRVLAQSIDISEATELREALRGIDEVYHLAGVLGTSELDDAMSEAVKINVLGAINVFEAAIFHNVPKLFYASKPNVWLNTYSVTKFAAEEIARICAKRGQTLFCGLRYFNVYGPGQSPSPIRKIIPSFAQRALKKLPLQVFGDGSQIVDMVYAKDVGDITVRFTRSINKSCFVDCGRGIGLSVNEIARIVNELTGNTSGVEHLPMRAGEVENSILVANTDPLCRILNGELDFTDWRTSLETTIEWYR